jgi:hypothetical protein
VLAVKAGPGAVANPFLAMEFAYTYKKKIFGT